MALEGPYQRHQWKELPFVQLLKEVQAIPGLIAHERKVITLGDVRVNIWWVGISLMKIVRKAVLLRKWRRTKRINSQHRRVGHRTDYSLRQVKTSASIHRNRLLSYNRL